MSTIMKFKLKELRKLANDKNSCVIEKKVTQNLALQPWYRYYKDSIFMITMDLLDCKIGKFDKEFNGILLSYKNLRVLQDVGSIRNDNADIHFQVQADYFIFRPHVGATLKGVVYEKSITHLRVLVHRVFNIVIPRPTEEPGNEWIGSNIKEGQEVVFQIVVLDLYGALPYIRGKLDERSLALGADGDDEAMEMNTNNLINITYVNFDKTKPSLKQVGDVIPKEKSNSCNTIKNSCNGEPSNEASTSRHEISPALQGVEASRTQETILSEPLKTRNQAKNLKGSVKNEKSKHQDTKVKRAKRTAMPLPKSILKKNEVDENSLLTPRSRSCKEKDLKKETSKKVQITSPPRVNKSQGNPARTEEATLFYTM